MKLENHDYENALLGAILLDNRVLDEYKVKPALFDAPLSRKIFAQMEKFRALGMSFNMVDVGLQLPDIAADVARLTDVNSAANVKFYYDALVELAKRRGLVKLARDMTALVHEAESTGEVFAHVDKSLVEITDNSTSGYCHIATAASKAMQEIEDAAKRKGAIGGIDTGFEELNSKTDGWQRQEFIVIGARPGAGKTSIALNCCSSALRQGYPVGFFSAEMSAASLVKRLIADWGSIQFNSLRSGFMGMDQKMALPDVARRLVESKFFINDTPSIKLNDLISESRRMKRNENIGIVFVDYLSLVANKTKGVPRHEQVAEISGALKGLARELDIPVIALSQLTREAQGERPKLSQLRDSGAVEQDADLVLLLWNQGWTDDTKEYIKITMIVEKNRNGANGDIEMIFKPSYMRFKEVEK